MVGTWTGQSSTGRWILIVAGGALTLALGSWVPKPYRLIYNASGSVPVGWYWNDRQSHPHRGALMLVILPARWRQLAAVRRYLPRDMMALKRVAGGPGDLVCADGSRVLINGRLAAIRLARDALGRSLPAWTGCARLRADQWFVLNPAAQSFDSRYIGAVPTIAFRGEAVAL